MDVKGPEMVFNGWKIVFVKGPIMNSDEMETFEAEFDMPSLPEMLHGTSIASFHHIATGKSVAFSAKDALKEWRKTCFDRRAPQVVHSEAWRKERAESLQDIPIKVCLGGGSCFPSHSHHQNQKKKEYDWTFASDYWGTLGGGAALSDTTQTIPYDKLKIQEPILFFDSQVLFEDELGDNGTCIETVKLRVMPSGFFCLHRLFTRVDEVVCTIRDTRIYHAFHSASVLHEYQVRSNPWAEIKKRVPDPSKYADDAFMWDLLTQRSLVTKAIAL